MDFGLAKDGTLLTVLVGGADHVWAAPVDSSVATSLANGIHSRQTIKSNSQFGDP
jgi:hypothetical protein